MWSHFSISRYAFLLFKRRLITLMCATEKTSILASFAIIAASRKSLSHLQHVRWKSSSYGMLVYGSDHWPRNGVWFPSVLPAPMPCKLDLHATAFGPLPNWLHLIPIDVPGALWYFIRQQHRDRVAGLAYLSSTARFYDVKFQRASTNDGPATKNRAEQHDVISARCSEKTWH